jgi:hypothetical protein
VTDTPEEININPEQEAAMTQWTVAICPVLSSGKMADQ